jgi:hypothetical protein
METTPNIHDYMDIWRRLDNVVKNLTESGKIEEADFLMVQFFVFFDGFDTLREHVVNAEEMLVNNEW